MSSLAATTLRRHGVGALTIVNRTPSRAERLAASVDGVAGHSAELPSYLVDADLVVSCTGAVGTVVSAEAIQAAMAARPDRPLFVLDLALPRDVEPAVRDIAGVTVVDLESLRSVLESVEVSADVEASRRIVTDEVASFLTKQRSERVAPTVAALRARAQQVVDMELQRLRSRLPELDERAEREIAIAVARVVDKLLHAPTVRVKELAGSPGGESYAALLRELFALDPSVTEAVARADVVVEDQQ
jgi:glutamyl-tRNA reductase